MKRINVTLIRTILIVLVIFLLLMMLIAFIVGQKDTGGEVLLREPSFAPAEYAYPEFFTEQDLASGYKWKIADDNTITVKDDGGAVYHVTSDGTIYEEKENGGLVEVKEGENRNRILDAVIEARNDSEAVAAIIGNTNLENLKTLTDEDIRKLVGDTISAELYRYLLENGVGKEKIQEYVVDSGYKPQTITQLIASGIAPEDLDKALKRLDEIDRRLSATIQGTGVSLDDLKAAIAASGLTEEEYLLAAERMTSQEDSVLAESTKKNTGKDEDRPKASDMPAMTVNLGGSKAATEGQTQGNSGSNYSSLNAADLASAIASAQRTETTTEYDLQNGQGAKVAFAGQYSENTGMSYLSTNDIASGTIISMVLITGLNSDLPGLITAEVTQNVYDSLSGTILLIPKGTKLIASYDSSVSWGQRRALVVWTELVRPDGLVLKLPGLSGVDKAGYSGYSDKVDNHVWTIIKSAFLASLLDLMADEVKYEAEDLAIRNASDAVGVFTDTLDSAAQQYLKKQINIQPTLRIRPGRTVKLIVNQTLTLTPYRR